MHSESDFLAWVATQQRVDALTLIPAGDDLAVLRWPSDDLLLVGVDQVLDGVHFDSTKHAPELIGRKAMNRNLSDCAAMGCLPAAAVVSAAVPRGVGLEYLKALYGGMRMAADRFECAIVGGDTGSWDGKLALTVTILGRSAGLPPVGRTGARVGDGIYVTGALGGSILGRHLSFEPQIVAGRSLAASGVVSAMIDLSDGLSRDLPRILSGSSTPKAGASLNGMAIPIHSDADIDRLDGKSSLEHALHDGEDYELLFTAARNPPLGTRIGVVSAVAGISVKIEERLIRVLPSGWDHSL